MEIEFSNPKRKNQPQRMSLKATRDVIVSNAEDDLDKSCEMSKLFEAAKILRRCILKCDKWEFKGSIGIDEQQNAVPMELNCSVARNFSAAKTLLDTVTILFKSGDYRQGRPSLSYCSH